jgi:nucleoside-diphosphate-sugar epimerase
MRYLVTGADGFVGSTVVTQLLREGHSVLATSNDGERAAHLPWFKDVKYEELELGAPGLSMPRSFSSVDRVIHLAWSGLPRYLELVHIEESLRWSYRFLKTLAEEGVGDFTVLGTCLEYGMRNGELAEDMESRPEIPYAVAKDALRRFLEQLQRTHPFHFKWIRLFYVYGPGQRENSLIGALDAAIARGDEAFEMSPGEQIRDYLPIDEAARAIVAISAQQTVQGIINCGSGMPISVRRFVEQYLEHRGASITLKFGFKSYPDYEPLAFWASTEKLRRALGEER